MSGHTPGPWEIIEPKDGGGYTIRNPLIDEQSGAEFYAPIVWEMGGIDSPANARLIAAAPDLLAACEAALSDTLKPVHLQEPTVIIPQLKAAIRKARGD